MQTEKKGWGLRAAEPIKANDFVIEYVGEVIASHQCIDRLEQQQDRQHFCILTLDGNDMIDASEKGGLARFINHSCNPNCQTQKW